MSGGFSAKKEIEEEQNKGESRMGRSGGLTIHLALGTSFRAQNPVHDYAGCDAEGWSAQNAPRIFAADMGNDENSISPNRAPFDPFSLSTTSHAPLGCYYPQNIRSLTP